MTAYKMPNTESERLQHFIGVPHMHCIVTQQTETEHNKPTFSCEMEVFFLNKIVWYEFIPIQNTLCSFYLVSQLLCLPCLRSVIIDVISTFLQQNILVLSIVSISHSSTSICNIGCIVIST